MAFIDEMKRLVRKNDTKILFLVLDGLGGMPDPKKGDTELERAKIPNFDALARESACGLAQPCGSGITPGSGPSHLSLFGYDPFENKIGRGALSAAGVGFPMKAGDVAARGNFATFDGEGKITDRRAGRIETSVSKELCGLLQSKVKEKQAEWGVEVFVEPEKEHRAAVVFRGDGLTDELSDVDPQKEGVPAKKAGPINGSPDGKKTADVVNRFVDFARETLKEKSPANGMLLRGFAHPPEVESFEQRYGLKAAVLALYPMYRGLASLVGMETVESGDGLRSQIDALKNCWNDYDFFFFHVKGTDSRGEDGSFEKKIEVLEEIDGILPELRGMNPDVLVVSGDHSTPAVMAAHSWHPVPTILWGSPCFFGGTEAFTERECAKGTLGRFDSVDLMPQALAHAGRLEKYGA